MFEKTLDSKYLKVLEWLILISLGAYAAGLLTSISVLALAHIFILIPALYFTFKVDRSKLPKSAWALLFFALTIVLSVIINAEIMKNGLKPALKAKYFLFGFLSVAPFCFFLKNKLSPKRKNVLIWLMFTSSILALVGGTAARYTGFNPVTMKYVEMHLDRNPGLMGFVLNYAHNLSYFMTIFATLVIAFWKDLEKKNRVIYLVVLGLNIYALYTTYARGALLALIAGLAGYYLKDLKRLIATLVLFITLGAIGYFGNYENFKREGSDTLRLSMWETAVIAFKERPVFGWGYLNFEQHSRDIKIRHEVVHPEFGGHAHNSILEVLATTGLFGFSAFVIWIGLWVKELFSRNDKFSQVELAALCAVFVGGLTQSTIGLGINLFFIMLIYSLSAANTMRRTSL